MMRSLQFRTASEGGDGHGHGCVAEALMLVACLESTLGLTSGGGGISGGGDGGGGGGGARLPVGLSVDVVAKVIS